MTADRGAGNSEPRLNKEYTLPEQFRRGQAKLSPTKAVALESSRNWPSLRTGREVDFQIYQNIILSMVSSQQKIYRTYKETGQNGPFTG